MSEALEPRRSGRISPICIRAHGSTRIIKIWIGHAEDNRGLGPAGPHTLAPLGDQSTLPPERAKAAWHELYAAEGSDWFWWYGDDFDTAYKEEFDRLFRTHLRNVWTLAGMTPPDLLNQPLCEVAPLPDP